MPVNAKGLTLRPFLAGILTFKTVIHSAPEYAIFIQKIENFSGDRARSPSQAHPPAGGDSRTNLPPPLGAFGDRPLSPLQHPRYAA